MMDQGLDERFRPSLLNARFDELRQASPNIAPLMVIRRIVAAIGLRRARARSQQELRELSDLTLKDIGLRREDVGSPFPKLFWQCD
jgi:uncharacterized protein YjiS (DUF1127 family)